MVKAKYRGTTYDVYLKDTRTKNGGTTSITFLDKSKAGAIRQAKKTYKPFMKVTKVKTINKVYR